MTPRRITAFCVATSMLTIAAVAFGEGELTPALKRRVKNFSRPGWVVVDGAFVRTQADVSTGELFTFVDQNDHCALVARPSPRVEPMLKNYRTALVRLAGSDFAWKLSCPGRVWDETRSSGTQHLSLIAAADTVTPDRTMRLTKVDIAPHQQTVQGVHVTADFEVQLVTVVFGRDFVELALGPSETKTDLVVRAPSAVRLRVERPLEVRQALAPLLRLVCNGRSPLAPAAGDVYRAFPDLPTDPAAEAALRKILPSLTAAEPVVRQKASTALRDLGPRGVQAAMRMDATRLPPEAAARLGQLVADATRDARPPEQLRGDSEFLLDCLTDSDANVRTAAGRLVERPNP